MKKQIAFIIAFFFMTGGACAQTATDTDEENTGKKKKEKREFKNSIVFSGTDYYFKSLYSFGTFPGLEHHLFWRDDRVGIFYKRKIYKNFRIKIGYNQWNAKPLYSNPPFDDFWIIVHNDTIQAGTIETCSEYKMIDASALYVFNILKRHEISIGLGLSYTWGFNEVVDSVVVTPGHFDYFIFSHGEKAMYYGIVPEASYDFLCLRNRVSLGADIRYRKYFRFPVSTFEFGFHLGFNF